MSRSARRSSAKRVEALPDPKAIFGKGPSARRVQEVRDAVPGRRPRWTRRPQTTSGAGRGGGPPWRKQFGPVVSLEVPLETDDPSAPLWATVAARLPEEITTVGDDGDVVRYRYSAVGSTPQAPRYRRIAEPEQPFPASGPPPP